MTDFAAIEEVFFENRTLDPALVSRIVSSTLQGMDDGELFMEYRALESLLLDDGRIKSATNHISSGFGFRGVIGDLSSYSYATDISEQSIRQAAEVVKSINGEPHTKALPGEFQLGTNTKLYTDANPLNGVNLAAKVALLQEIDSYIRSNEAKVRQVTVSLSGEWQAVGIFKTGGVTLGDIRPLVRLNISVVAEHEGRMERGGGGIGGRMEYATFIAPNRWKALADDAVRQALVNLEARPAPAGEMQVVLGSGWPGVLLHEAVGHGLEGDFNRKGSSFYSGKVGQQVAAKGVTVIDDGTIMDRRGSLSLDDEGTPTSRTVLIEDGILKGYMQDRMNARLMGVQPTGNGRRESFAHQPMPRMTNTFMLPGLETRDSIISGVKKGIYAVNFGGGQVDITSGKFVFSASEAYMIENGEVTHPVKGVTLIGNGADTMNRITAIGNDLKLDDGIGTCGKAGQSVPVGVGQPTLLIDRITVGGTEISA